LRTPDQIATQMARLWREIEEEYGKFLEPLLLKTMVVNQLHAKVMEQIDAVISSFSADDACVAIAALEEIEVDEKKASVIREKQ
jgi:hypothetical protein